MKTHKCEKDNKYIISTNSDCVVTDVETGIVLAVVLAKTQKVIVAISDSFTTSVDCCIRPFVEATSDVDLFGGGDDYLPAGYQRVEYLESSGTQWIDTEIKGDSETEVCAKFQVFFNTTMGMRVYGSYYDGKHITFYASPEGGNCRFGNQTQLIVTPNREDVIVIQNKSGISLNGKFYSYGQGIDFETASSLFVFAINGFTSGNQFMGRLYSFKLYKSGVILDLIPILDENGAPCMYDKVSRKCFYNLGSGEFIYPNATPVMSTDLDDVLYGKMTENGIRRLYKVPCFINMSKDEYAAANGYKEIVEPQMPTEGYWTPQWRETDTQLLLEWIETEPPDEEV